MYKDIYIKFFELKYLQLASTIVLKSKQQIAYNQDEMGDMFEFVELQGIYDAISNELMDFIKEHDGKLALLDIDKPNPEYVVSNERQRQLTKERFNKEYTFDDLVNIMEKSK